MLANTADAGTLEYNTADGTLWFLHAVGRHVERTGDVDLAAELVPGLLAVVEAHVRGTRYGIGVDPADGLLSQGEEGSALTWMDARVDGLPVTPRAGKAVELNALWVNGLAVVAGLCERLGRDGSSVRALESQARSSFSGAFVPRRAGCRRLTARRRRPACGRTSSSPSRSRTLRCADALRRGPLRAAPDVARPSQPRPGRSRLQRPPPRRPGRTRPRLPPGHGLALAHRAVRRGRARVRRPRRRAAGRARGAPERVGPRLRLRDSRRRRAARRRPAARSRRGRWRSCCERAGWSRPVEATCNERTPAGTEGQLPSLRPRSQPCVRA